MDETESDDFCLNINYGSPEQNVSQSTISAVSKNSTKIQRQTTKLGNKKVSGVSSKVSEPEAPAKKHNDSSRPNKHEIIDDPLLFHAKPRELSKNAIKIIPNHSQTQTVSTSHVFSRNSFSELSLNSKLQEHLESSSDTGGLGLQTSTQIQNVVLPLLAKRRQNLLLKSQTGSGKTLAYLLPILNDLMSLSPPVERADGTLALILAPTRELSAQISDVLHRLTKCCVWIVGGSISGGEKKKSEKARLRKGVGVLVCTPGRLLDHLKTTESFSLKRLRWIVLDEADRLLDMGFEQSVLDILNLIRGTPPSTSLQTKDPGGAQNLQSKWKSQSSLQAKRCDDLSSLVCLMASATLTRAVRRLARPAMAGQSFSVVDADRRLVREIDDAGKFADEDDAVGVIDLEDSDDPLSKQRKAHTTDLDKGEVVSAPLQLSQYFMFVTAKWRLSALLSFLRTHTEQKTIVFFSTCDSVDFYSLLLREAAWPEALDPTPEFEEGKTERPGKKRTLPEDSSSALVKASAASPLMPLDGSFSGGVLGPDCQVHRLHGNLPQSLRQEVFKKFCQSKSGVLLTTDVAARGLDVPHVDWILQFDPPSETADYVHRIGRTARKGQAGSALLFLLPSEAQYVSVLGTYGLAPQALSLQSMFLEASKHIPGAMKFKNVDEMSAVILQRRMEGVVAGHRVLTAAASQAYRSFVRAYATHSSDTKAIFRIQTLHLGHLAKAFALKDSPQAQNVKSKEDIFGLLQHGTFSPRKKDFSASTEPTEDAKLSRKEKKKLRDEKYSLSSQHSKKKQKSDTQPLLKSLSPEEKKPKSFSKDNGSQRLRNMGLRPSGKFRKAGGGYFKKKLRAQAASEFSS